MEPQYICLVIIAMFSELETILNIINPNIIEKIAHNVLHFIYFLVCLSMLFHPVLCWFSTFSLVVGFTLAYFIKNKTVYLIDSVTCLIILTTILIISFIHN